MQILNVNSWMPFFDASFAPQSTTVINVDLTDSSAVTFSLPPVGSGLSFSYQKPDGTALSGIPTTGIVTVNKSALGSNGFSVVISNTTSGTLSPQNNREYFSFALSSTVTTFVYALDTTNNQIDIFSSTKETVL